MGGDQHVLFDVTQNLAYSQLPLQKNAILIDMMNKDEAPLEFKSEYQSRDADEQGFVTYSASENEIWHRLYQRQMQIVTGRACDEHMEGLALLGLSEEKIPQLPEVNKRLKQITGWSVAPVDALISHQDFFELLANRIFPAATFIRKPEEFDYIKEPDIFHELFGHCPMLTQPDFANFTQKYAETVLSRPESDWPLLQRLFWFTVEFGLIQTSNGLRAYGGGILSSPGETVYCVESPVPLRVMFHPLVALRTPYRIDQMQPVYFIIESYKQLYDFMTMDIDSLIAQSRELGEFPALFEVEPNNPSIHVYMC